MRDTLIKFWDMGIQSFLIFGDNCRIFFKDMGYFLKKLMGYGILGPPPPLPGPQFFAVNSKPHSLWDHTIRLTFAYTLKKKWLCYNPTQFYVQRME